MKGGKIKQWGDKCKQAVRYCTAGQLVNSKYICHAVLDCSALPHTITLQLNYTVLHYSPLYHTLLYYITLQHAHFTLLYYSILILHTIPYRTVRYNTVPEGDKWGSTAGPHRGIAPVPVPVPLLLLCLGVSAVTVTAAAAAGRVGDWLPVARRGGLYEEYWRYGIGWRGGREGERRTDKERRDRERGGIERRGKEVNIQINNSYQGRQGLMFAVGTAKWHYFYFVFDHI